MNKMLPHVWLFLQMLGLLMATSLVAGGGQYPDNAANPFVFVKFALFILPVLTFALKSTLHPAWRNRIVIMLHDNALMLVAFTSIAVSLPLAAYLTFSLERYAYTWLGLMSLLSVACQYESRVDFTRHVTISVSILLIFLAGLALLSSDSGLRNIVQAFGSIHPNMLSSLCAQLLIILLFQHTLYPLQHILRLALLLGLSVVIGALQSRGVWFSLSLSLLICAFHAALCWRCRKAVLALCGIGLFISAALFITLIQPDSGQAALDLVTRGQTLDDFLTLTGRTDLWATLFQSASLKQMLVGYGYAVMSPSISVDFGSGLLYGAHSGYLSLYFGTGFVTVLLFLASWFIKLITLRINFRDDKAAFQTALASFCLFFINAVVAEEFGLHITPTFVLLFLNFNLTCPVKTL